MKNYILLYALCFACPQLQAMTIKDRAFSDSLIQSSFGIELPEVPVINNPFAKLALTAGVAASGVLVGVITDFALRQDRQLTLHDYVIENKYWGVRLTLLLGADPYHKTFLQDGLATTAIHEAVKHHAAEILTLFLARTGDVDVQDSAIQTALHVAAKSKDTQARTVIQMLVARGACLQATDKNGNSPLHLAVQNQSASSAEELLKLNADINAQNFAGYTPLHKAASHGSLAQITFLLEHGARTDILTKYRCSASEIARRNRHRDAADILQNAEEQRQHFNAQLALHVSTHGRSITERTLYREIGY